MKTQHIVYTARPSALHFMLQAFRPSSGWRKQGAFPDLKVHWKGFRISEDELRLVQEVADHDHPPGLDRLGILLPHVSGFRQLMVVVTHPQWPLAIWNSLQVRNRLVLHRPLRIGDAYDLDTRVAAWRVLDKAIEVDLHTAMYQGDACAWESVVTFYYRGRFGPPSEQGKNLGPPAGSPKLDQDRGTATNWRVQGKKRWQFGAITGDYNGIHQWDGYARRFGFPAAFAHSQRVLAQCMAHLAVPSDLPQQLDLWIKGPVFYDREVVLRQEPRAAGKGQDFAVHLVDDTRPALVGSWRSAAEPL